MDLGAESTDLGGLNSNNLDDAKGGLLGRPDGSKERGGMTYGDKDDDEDLDKPLQSESQRL